MKEFMDQLPFCSKPLPNTQVKGNRSDRCNVIVDITDGQLISRILTTEDCFTSSLGRALSGTMVHLREWHEMVSMAPGLTAAMCIVEPVSTAAAPGLTGSYPAGHRSSSWSWHLLLSGGGPGSCQSFIFLVGIGRTGRRHHSQVRIDPWATFLNGVEPTNKLPAATLAPRRVARPGSTPHRRVPPRDVFLGHLAPRSRAPVLASVVGSRPHGRRRTTPPPALRLASTTCTMNANAPPNDGQPHEPLSAAPHPA
jgi:hypothetical protein